MYGLLKSGEVVRFVKSDEEGEFYVGVKEKIKDDQSNLVFVHNDNIEEYDSNLLMLQMKSQQIKDVKCGVAHIITFEGRDHLTNRDINIPQNTFAIGELTVENLVKAYTASMLYQLNPELKFFNDENYSGISEYIYLNDIIEEVSSNAIANFHEDSSSTLPLVYLLDNKDKEILIKITRVKSV